MIGLGRPRRGVRGRQLSQPVGAVEGRLQRAGPLPEAYGRRQAEGSQGAPSVRPGGPHDAQGGMYVLIHVNM